jgi:RNA polymerase sigma factor (sigma-70 family)
MDKKVYQSVKRMASRFGNEWDTPEDVEQAAVVAILEREAKDPSFSLQTQSYQVHAGRYAAWASVRSGQRRGQHESSSSKLAAGLQYELEDDYLDTLVGETLSLEDHLERAEQAVTIAKALETLSPQESKVLEMVVDGLGTGDIAKALGVSAPAVSCYKNRIVKKITVALAD